MKNTVLGMVAAGAMAASLVMFGCGAQQPAKTETATQETTTQQAPADTKKDTKAQTTTETKPQETTTQQQAPAQTETQPTQSTQDAQISLDEATQIALDDAGVTAADVIGLDAKLETDDGVTKYDVDFKVGNVEHDYDIDPTTGAIISHTTDIDD